VEHIIVQNVSHLKITLVFIRQIQNLINLEVTEMFIRMNEGESIVIQARNSDNPKKSICVICRGNWVGLKEFDNAPDIKRNSEKTITSLKTN